MSREAYHIQRDFALASGLQSQIIWDSIAPDQSHMLKEKIRTLLPCNRQQNRNEVEKNHQNLFNNIWKQRKYTNRTLLSSIIYILVAEERDFEQAKYSQKFSCHPVFRTRKCLNSDNSFGCCMIFIDEFGRVYKNWHNYLETNILPKGTMIAPMNGVYLLDDNDEVLLEYHRTPAASTKSQVLNTTDTAAGITGLVATVPLAAAIVAPIAAPVIVAASAVTLTTAAWCTLRSTMQLRDRNVHDQSLALTDRGARGNWIGIASGAVGIGAIGATNALTYAAAAGREISLGTKVAVNSINASSILVSGTGVVNSFYDIYLKVNNEEKLCGQDILQLASTLLVFTNSVNNLNITLKVFNDPVSGVPIRIRLVERLRTSFNRVTQEIANTRMNNLENGHSSNTFDMIRTADDIPLRENLLNLHRMNLNLDGNNIENSMEQAANRLSKGLPNLIQKLLAGNSDVNISLLTEEMGIKFVQHIINQNNLLEIISAMSKYLNERLFRFLLNLARTFIENFVDEIDSTIGTFISTELVLYKMLKYCMRSYSELTYEFLESKTIEILSSIETYFKSLNPNSDGVARHYCKICNGYFVVTDL